MKKIFTLALATVIVFAVNAQDKKKSSSDKSFTFGVGPSLSFPIGDMGLFYSFGYGAEAQATYHASESFNAFAQVGYNNFSVKSSVGSGSTGFIPFLVGGRYVSNGFTAGAGIGYGSFSGGGASSGGFAYSPQIGYSFNNVQVLAHYTGVSASGGSNSFIGVKAFYNF